MYVLHTATGEALRTTSDHPFYVRGQWVRVKRLRVGDSLVSQSGQRHVLRRIELKPEHVTVYNFTVDELHTYFVGQQAILVRNVSCPDLVKVNNKVPHAKKIYIAREAGFKKAGMTNLEEISFSKVDPKTGTVVEFKGKNGSKVAYDSPHADMNAAAGHDQPHVGYQTAGKRGSGGTNRGNITYDGPQHPHRPDVKQ